MVVMAAAVFFGRKEAVVTIEAAHSTLGPLLGGWAALLFGIALLASGLSSSTVGTMAGQVILDGFLNIRMSIFLRRLLTMIPALAVIGFGFDPLRIIVMSQVCLSFTLPFALVPLILLTRRRDVMGVDASPTWLHGSAWLSVTVILALNALLLYQTFGGKF